MIEHAPTIELRDEDAAAVLVEHWRLEGVPDTGEHTVKRTLAVARPARRVGAHLPPVLGRGADYSLSEQIAEGGMARIHLAQQRSIERSVAIKIIKERARDDRAREQLLREARIAGSLEHPNIIPIHTVGLDEDGEPVLVMKHIEGISWQQYMQQDARRMVIGETPLERNIRVLMEVAKAAHFAHTRGIVHRDLKPDNVMIGRFGDVYLLDWGIAIRLAEESRPNGVAGTPGYMAPEMVTEKTISPRTDVYLLGAILYELLSGSPPHGGKSIYAALLKAWRGEPLEFPATAPHELVSLCKKAMAHDPEDRYRDAQAFRQACAAFLRHQTSHALAENAAARKVRLIEAIQTMDDVEPAHTTVYRYFGAARFGFEQALHSWSGNQPARAGLADTLGLMARFELDHGNPSGAEALLDELSAMGCADLALTQLIARARSRQTQTELELVSLRRLADAMNTGLGARTRSRVAAGLALALGSLSFLAGWLQHRFLGDEVDPVAYLTHGALWGGITVYVLWRLRRKLMQNTASRQLAVTAMALVVGGFFLRILTAIGDLPFYNAFPLEFGFYAVTIGQMGYNARPRFDFAALPMGIGALAMSVWPWWLFEWAGITVFLTLSIMAVVWHPRFSRKVAAPSGGPSVGQQR